MIGIVGSLGERCANSPDSAMNSNNRCACARCFIAQQYCTYVTSDLRRVSAALVRRTMWLPRKVSL